MTVIRGGRGRVSIETDRDNRVSAAHGWDKTPENLRRFLASVPPSKRQRDRDGAMWFHVALVPHPHNTYSSAAISVSAPWTEGSTLAGRHLAYLPQYYIDYLGHGVIPHLAEIGGGEVEVMASIWPAESKGDRASIYVALDKAPILREAARDFVAGLDPNDGEASLDPELGIDAAYRHTKEQEETRRTLELVGGFSSPRPEPFHGVWLNPLDRLSPVARRYGVIAAASGRLLGWVEEGLLLLRDERDRDATLTALTALGLSVEQPREARWVDPGSAWPGEEPPNVGTDLRFRAIHFRCNSTERTDDFTFALFNRKTRKLWVEDSRLLDVALVHAARLGLDVQSYGLPRQAWTLERDVPFNELEDHSVPRPYLTETAPSLLRPLRKLVPTDTFKTEVTWRNKYLGGHPESDEIIAAQERNSRARDLLIPWAEATDRLGDCRLCGCPALALEAPRLDGTVAYCSQCLSEVLRGLVSNRKRAAAALAALSSHEFGGEMVMEDQLETVQAPADLSPVDSTWLDRALLLRMGIRRGRLPWTLMLVDAGIAGEGIRTGRGTVLSALAS